MILKKFSCGILVFALSGFSSVFGAANDKYTDVNGGDSYSEAVNNMAVLAIMQGDKGKFRPNSNITRAEVAKVLETTLGYTKAPASNSNSFYDVKKGNWYTDIVYLAEELNLIKGTEKNKKKYFMPQGNLTYAEFATMAIRALGYKDGELIGKWPTNFINKANELGLFSGLGKVNTSASAKRSDVAVMINNMLNLSLNNTSNKLIGTVKDKLGVTVVNNAVTDTPAIDSSLTQNQVKIGEQVFTIGSNQSELLNDIGRNVKAYVKNNRLLYIINVAGNSVAFKTSRDGVSTGNTGMLYYKDPTGVDQSYNFKKDVKVILNGKSVGNLAEIKKGTDITAVDNNNDNNYDYVIGNKKTNSKIIYGKVVSITPASNSTLETATINGMVYDVKDGANVSLGQEASFIVEDDNLIVEVQGAQKASQDKLNYGFLTKVNDVGTGNNKAHYAKFMLLDGTIKDLVLADALNLKDYQGKLETYSMDSGNVANINIVAEKPLNKSNISSSTIVYAVRTDKDGSINNSEVVDPSTLNIEDGMNAYEITSDSSNKYKYVIIIMSYALSGK
jgi:hypothetical protein